MTTYNAYATRAELLRELMSADDSAEPNVVDDEVLDDILTDASRAVDEFCGGRQFWASSQTLRLSTPGWPERMRLTRGFRSTATGLAGLTWTRRTTSSQRPAISPSLVAATTAT